MAHEVPGAPVHASPRVTLEDQAEQLVPESPAWTSRRATYLERFPEAVPMTRLGDFMFVAIHLTGARQVAGFGAARWVDVQELARVLRPMSG